jgi:hypothetical protein
MRHGHSGYQAAGGMNALRRPLRWAVFGVRLICVGWLVRYHAFPDVFDGAVSGYRGIFSQDVLLMDSWMRILFNGRPIGFNHSTMELDDADPEARHVIRDTLQARLNILGADQKLYVDATVRLDDVYELRRFSFNLSSANYSLRLDAVRQAPETFRVTLETGDSTQTTTVTVPRDVVIYSPMTELAMRRLKPGQSLTLRTLDPATLSTAPLTIRALRRETLALAGATNETTVLTTDYQGAVSTTWMDAAGRVLRQETPFGWVLESCGMDEAVRAFSRAEPGVDMLAALAVPATGLPADPRAAARLRLQLTGTRFEPGELDSPRQRVLSLTTNGAEVLLLADTLPEGPVPPPGAGFEADLAATVTLQAEHPDIVARARAITEGLDDPARRARAIFDWVHRSVAKEATLSLPSALDVLKTLRGDCNEHTALFVALARAAGIPARMKVGLAFHKGAFYYHAWPAVYLDGWRECDPTWGTPGVDATHLALAEGEPGNQLRLAKAMGRLRIAAVAQDGKGSGDD